jgi:hypothetical protein
LVCAWGASWVGVGAPPGGGVLSAPAVVASGTDGSYLVFVQGADHKLWGRSWCATCHGFGAWFTAPSLTLAAGTAPTVATLPSGVQEVFVRGSDTKLYAIQQACPLGACGFDVNGFSNLGGSALSGSPSAVTTGNGWLEVFSDDTAGNVHERVYVPGIGWYGWIQVTQFGQLNPTVTSSSAGTIQMLTTYGASNNLRQWNYAPTP